MINRILYSELIKWKNSSPRKVLILRGARQVGKTSLIDKLGESFDQYLYFNLERKKDKDLFKDFEKVEETVQLLFLNYGFSLDSDRTSLIFIDEAQELPRIIDLSRYYRESYPHLHFIIAGSLLEFAIDEVQRVPVGRVEYLELHPINFYEYLNAINNSEIINKIENFELTEIITEHIFTVFHEYVLIGGMPEIVQKYINEKNIIDLMNTYNSLWESYTEDVEKYSKNNTLRQVIRHVINTITFEIENRITFDSFGNSSYKAREVKEALQCLEKAKLIHLIYPTVNAQLPIVSDFGKKPRLSFLDIGLINYKLGIQKELLFIQDLNEISKGKLTQLFILQELRSKQSIRNQVFNFWVRQKSNSSAEVDLVIAHKGLVIPIEVKSGATGKLRSLHQFMDECDHHYAVRLYKGIIKLDTVHTRSGKEFKLLSLPYYLAYWLESYIDRYLFCR